jgi:hypothetical protein
MRVLRRLARGSTWRVHRFRRARTMPDYWPYATGGQRPGISEGAATLRGAVPEPISLTGENLIVNCGFVPELAEGQGAAGVWPEMNYGADVSPPEWNQGRSDFDVFERPVPEARHAWFDFFRPDYDWLGQPASDYLRNRIARLTLDLKTGEAQIQR